MSAPDTLNVRTLAGLTLRLSHTYFRHAPDTISASLDLPLSRAERRAHRLFGQRVAFLAGGSRLRDVYIDPRCDRYPSAPPSLWLGNASIDIDDATAATVQAWLDSRTPFGDHKPAAMPAPELPPDLPTPDAVERAA